MSLFQKIQQKLSNNQETTTWPGLIKAYKNWLPVTDETPIITLQEGGTPLLRVQSIERRIGRDIKVYVKYELAFQLSKEGSPQGNNG